MPGIEVRAPDRTDTSNGSFLSPKRLPARRLSFSSAVSTWGFRSPGSFFEFA
jgi:hypothetical protein